MSSNVTVKKAITAEFMPPRPGKPSPAFNSPPSFATAGQVTAFIARMQEHKGQLPRRVYMIANPEIRTGPNWETIKDTVLSELPGIELVDFLGANMRSDRESKKRRYDDMWPDLLSTLGAVVAVPTSHQDRKPTLGPVAAAEMQAATERGLPVFLYDPKGATLHTGIDCGLVVIPPPPARSGRTTRRALVVSLPRPSQPYLPTKIAALSALGVPLTPMLSQSGGSPLVVDDPAEDLKSAHQRWGKATR